MAKVSRNMLKTLVKECLFEILLESTGDTSSQLTETRARRVPAARKKTATKRRVSRPALDALSFSSKEEDVKPMDVSGLTSDPIMQSIFQDTAATTLVEQHNAERGGPAAGGDRAARVVSQSDPTALFGEASQNWAHLAFDGEIE